MLSGRRISSTKYHEPLKRIHSRSRSLEKLDKTDGSPKKDKRRSREIRVLPKIFEEQVAHDYYDVENERPRSMSETITEKRKHHHRHHGRHHHHEHKDRKDKKDKGKDVDIKDLKDVGETKPHHHHHRRHHHHPLLTAPHHHRTISEREQLESRLRSGALTLREIEPIQERLATEKDEASQLAKRDLEEMACKLQ